MVTPLLKLHDFRFDRQAARDYVALHDWENARKWADAQIKDARDVNALAALSAADYGATIACGNATSGATITTVAAYAVSAPSPYNFGSVNLPAAATKTLTFTIPGGGSGAVASVKVVTMGAENLDFTQSGTETCSGKSLVSASTCTVTVQFLPLRAGWRKGGSTA